MKKSILLGFVASVAGVAGSPQVAPAQDVDNYFSRDRNIAVLERAKDDYTPLGIDLGSFMVQPYVGLDIGDNDNVKYVASGKQNSPSASLTPGFDATSTWSQNKLAFGINGDLTNYSNASSEDEGNWTAYANGEYDISSHMSVTAELSHSAETESRASPLADPLEVKPAKFTNDSIDLGYSVVGNRLKLVIDGSAIVQKFDNVGSTDGGIINETARDVTYYDQTAKLFYAVSPAVSIYGAINQNERQYDALSARINNSTGSILSVGSDFDLTDLMRGNVQIGSISQNYSHSDVGKLSNLYYNGTVQWFPTPLMTVTGAVGRSYIETGTVTLGPTNGVANVGALESSASVGVDHELLRNLILSAKLASDSYQYTGISRTDTTTAFSFGAQYYLNRRLSVRAGYSFAKLTSVGSDAFRSYTDNQIQVGLLFKY